MGPWDLLSEAAYKMGLPEWKLDRLRRRGLIPEAVRAGRYHVFPADKLSAIRDRLLAAGYLKPGDIRQAVANAS